MPCKAICQLPHVIGAVLWISLVAAWLLPRFLNAQDHSMSDMPAMGMETAPHSRKGAQDDMGDMGPSMAAMKGHMKVTAKRQQQPGDEEKARTVVAQAKATMERYQDYRKALADGYAIANPKLEQAQYHFNHAAHAQEAETRFDPTRPTSLLYRRTPHKQFQLEGVMYTAKPDATEEELNARIPLSVVRWHEHINFCAAPADRVREYHGAHPTFGMFGSINSEAACHAAHGNFYPVMFTWMIHVFPYEPKWQDVFSMNDDVAHVH